MFHLTPSSVRSSLLIGGGVAGEIWPSLRTPDLEISRQLQNMESAWLFFTLIFSQARNYNFRSTQVYTYVIKLCSMKIPEQVLNKQAVLWSSTVTN